MKHLITLTPNDVMIQIVPQIGNEQPENKVSIPDETIGFTIPMNLFFADYLEKDFCGTFEVNTIYYNESIKRDIINELYENEATFDIYVRLTSSKENIKSPKVLQIFNNVHINGREFIIPEVGRPLTYRYYFTNTVDPWAIPIEKIEAMRPPNQYFYDYAVSKAVKDLKYPIENLTASIKDIKNTLLLNDNV